MKEIDETKINRIEVINHANNNLTMGRLLTLYQDLGDFNSIQISIQDSGKTLKIFLDQIIMSTTFGIPVYPVDDTILLDEEGELQPYISKNFFNDIFFRSLKNSRWLNDFASKLPDETKVYALDNSHQGIYTIGDIKKLMKEI